jgi:hypothetical protein
MIMGCLYGVLIAEKSKSTGTPCVTNSGDHHSRTIFFLHRLFAAFLQKSKSRRA